MKPKVQIFILLFSSKLFSQQVINYEIPVEGNIFLAKEIAIPKINMGYTVWLPDSGNANGLIVFTDARRDTLKSDLIIEYALKNQLAAILGIGASVDSPALHHADYDFPDEIIETGICIFTGILAHLLNNTKPDPEIQHRHQTFSSVFIYKFNTW